MDLRLALDELRSGPIPDVGPMLILFGLSFFLLGIRLKSRAANYALAAALLACLGLMLDPPDAIFASPLLSSALFYALWGGAMAFGASRGFTPLAGAASGAIVAATVIDNWFYDQLSVSMPSLAVTDLTNRVILLVALTIDRAIPGSMAATTGLLGPAGLWIAENAGWLARIGAGLIGSIFIALAGPRRKAIPFGAWRLGKAEIAALAILAAMFLTLRRHDSDEIRALRMAYLAAPFAIQGTSVVWRFGERLELGPAGRGFLAALGLVPQVLLVYAAIGLADFMLDLRGFDRQPPAVEPRAKRRAKSRYVQRRAKDST